MDRPICLVERTRDMVDVVIDEYSSDYLVENALERDDKDSFVNLINSYSSKEDVPESTHGHMFLNDSVNCAASVLAGETAGLFDIRDNGTNPLHTAAGYSAPRLTALLLNNGSFVASAKSDWTSRNLKNVLPLEVALIRMGLDIDRFYANGRDSAIKLLTILCQPFLRDGLETVRLLAMRTKQLKSEFCSYLVGGKLVEVGALLMVSRDQLLSETGDDIGFKNIMDMHKFLLTKKEKAMENAEMLTLLEVFDRIGDKLAAYLQLDFHQIDDVVLEVATLLQDAGFHVKTEHIYEPDISYRSYSLPFNKKAVGLGVVNDNEERISTAFKYVMPNWLGRKLVYLGERPKGSLGYGNYARNALNAKAFSTVCSMKDVKSAYYPPVAVAPSFLTHRRSALIVAAIKKGLRTL